VKKEYIQVLTTVEKKEEAEKIAEILLKKRVGSCIQIFPITSLYWWKGKIEKAEEWMCFIKTKKNLYKKVEKLIKENHSYETPEIIAIPINEGSKSYLKWLNCEVKNENCKKTLG
jgi:periplasmic divalent cation tolerance protein